MTDRDQEIIARLRAEAQHLNAVQITDLLEELLGGMSPFSFVSYFSQAFPEIPLRPLLEARAWNRLSNASRTDSDIEELLGEWLPRKG